MRGSGYYWVKWYYHTKWIICKYDNQFRIWNCINSEEDYVDGDFYEIGKEEIIH
jgi:hypothetical protein